MQRIAIIGCSGVGKSTLAVTLGRRPRIEAALADLSPRQLIRLDGDRAIAAFLAGLSPQGA